MAKGKRTAQAEELDLVPIMNLVTILIPFLLMASSFVSLAVIDSTLPAIGEPQPQDEEEKEEDKLTLSVAITDGGYTILGAGGVLGNPDEGEEAGPTVPCTKPGCPTPDSYDIKELTRLLNQIKDRYEKEENVILLPDSHIPYEILVLTMDATREDPDTKVDGKSRLLFPYVVIAGGVQ